MDHVAIMKKAWKLIPKILDGQKKVESRWGVNKCAPWGKIKVGDNVNLERAMKADSRFGGHFVTGHVDTMGVIENIVKLKNYVEFQITVPQKFMKYLVAKGSVCIDGVSLTVGKVNKNMFSVYLIPITVKITTFGKKRDGDTVNVETDILARYLLR